jgi:hypothetical protein
VSPSPVIAKAVKSPLIPLYKRGNQASPFHKRRRRGILTGGEKERGLVNTILLTGYVHEIIFQILLHHLSFPTKCK